MVLRVEEDACLQRLFLVDQFKLVGSVFERNVMGTLEEGKCDTVRVPSGAESEEEDPKQAEDILVIGAQCVNTMAHAEDEAG